MDYLQDQSIAKCLECCKPGNSTGTAKHLRPVVRPSAGLCKACMNSCKNRMLSCSELPRALCSAMALSSSVLLYTAISRQQPAPRGHCQPTECRGDVPRRQEEAAAAGDVGQQVPQTCACPSYLLMSIRLPTALAGAPPNSRARESSGSSLRTATGSGMAGIIVGSRLKNASFSALSFTATQEMFGIRQGHALMSADQPKRGLTAASQDRHCRSAAWLNSMQAKFEHMPALGPYI